MTRHKFTDDSSSEPVEVSLSTLGRIFSVNSGMYYRIGDARWSAALDVSSEEAIEELAALTHKAEELGGAVMAAIEDADDELGNGAVVNIGVGTGVASLHIFDGRYVLCEPYLGAYSEEGEPKADELLVREITRPLAGEQALAIVDVPSGLLSISYLWAYRNEVEEACTQLAMSRAKKYVEIGADSEGCVLAVEPGQYAVYLRKVRANEAVGRIVLVAPIVR